MKHPWRGKPCAVCGRTNGYFQRATYDGAPDGGVSVHMDCLVKFWEQLIAEEWKDFAPCRPNTKSNTGRRRLSG